VFTEADVVLCLDVARWEKARRRPPPAPRASSSAWCPEAVVGSTSASVDLNLSAWAMDYQRLLYADQRIVADTTIGSPR